MKKELIGIFVCMLLVGTVLPVTGNVIVDKSPLSVVNGNTLYVGGDGPGNYTRIQDAIDNASDGDTVFVFSGTYNTHNISVDKSINLLGEDRDTTVIDGNNEEDVLYLSANGVYISGFTIQNSGYGEYPYYYAGIHVHSISNTITGNNISSNNGNAVSIYNSRNNIISDNIILYNKEVGLGLESSNNNIITGNTITSDNIRSIILTDSDSNTISSNNLSDNVIGLDLYFSNDNTIIGNTMTNNFLLGMRLWGHRNTVIGNKISSNNYLGGLEVYHAFDSTIKGNTISSNEGYGMYFKSESSRNIITENTISNNGEGIILTHYCNRNRFTSNTFSNNFYGINLSSSFNVFLKNNFLNNELHAFFDTAFRNQWLRNYWEGDDSIPVRINGTQSFYLKDRQDNIIWEIHIPWANFDWLPAQEPYDIGI